MFLVLFTSFFYVASLVGDVSTSEWMVEGRRLVPLMPRLVPQTVFTSTANQAASAMLEKNTVLPAPSQTCNKDGKEINKTRQGMALPLCIA